MYALTGATGHLGQSILRQAASSNINIRAIVRESSNRNHLEGFAADVVEASLEDVEALTEAFSECQVVIHAAAMINVGRYKKEAMRKVNVTGTANVLEACRRGKVPRMVYLSSIEAINLEKKERPITESHGFSNGDAILDYGDTKAEASKIIAEAGRQAAKPVAGEKRFPETVLLCPTAMLGPWDSHGGMLTDMLRRRINGKMKASIPGGFDYVDARDVAAAVMAAASGKGRSGEAYILSGTEMSVQEMMHAIDKVSGKRFPAPLIPVWLARLAGSAAEGWSKLTGGEAVFTKGSINILQIDSRISSEKARKELGFLPRPITESIADTVNWLTGNSA